MSANSRSARVHPLLPPPVFRVGITGHRPGRLTRVEPGLLAQQINAVLQAVATGAQTAAADVQLVLVSSLAEGVDRIAATAGMNLGFALHVPLPMPVDLYVGDFKDAQSAAEFHALLAAARRTFVLPPPEGDDRTTCYAAASNLVLNQSDLLLVVSDDGPSGGPGGAADTCRLAQDRGLLTVRVAATAGAEISFRQHPDPLNALTAAVHRILSPRGALLQQVELYRQERWPARHPAFAYGSLRLVAELRFAMPPRPGENTALPVRGTAAPYFHWADTLAMFFGERSRTASLRLQILATSSVIAALVNIPFSGHLLASRVLATAEIGFLLWLLIGVRHSRAGRWHDRWLRYRSIAEQLRCVDILGPLGLSSLQPDSDISEHPTQASLMPFLVRQIEAEQGLPNAVVDAAYLQQHLAHVRVVLRDQAAFHATAARRYRAAEKTLHRCGLVFFWIAALLALYDVGHGWFQGTFRAFMERHPAADLSISTLAAVLPALGAAAVAIVTQGEYKRLAERSASMHASLDRIATRLAGLGHHPSLSSVSTGCLNAAQVLSSEVRDWTDLVAARPPSLPV